MSTVEVSAGLLARAGATLPGVCVRHGRVAARRVRFVIKSQPKMRPVTEVLHPGKTALGRTLEYQRQLKLVKVDGWPLCATCARTRTIALILANVLFWGGLIGVIAGFAAGNILALLGGVAAILSSVMPFSYGSLPRLTQTEASADGQSVLVNNAHSNFATELRGLAARD